MDCITILNHRMRTCPKVWSLTSHMDCLLFQRRQVLPSFLGHFLYTKQDVSLLSQISEG